MRTFKDLLTPALDWIQEQGKPWQQLTQFLQAAEPELEKINFFTIERSNSSEAIYFWSVGANRRIVLSVNQQLGGNSWCVTLGKERIASDDCIELVSRAREHLAKQGWVSLGWR